MRGRATEADADKDEMEHLESIERLVRRVRWRVRAQAAFDRTIWSAAFVGVAFAVGVLLIKALVLPSAALTPLAIGAAAVVVLGALSGLLVRVPDISAASRLDHAGGLYDRLSSAVEFARLEHPTALHQAAIEDAATVVDRASPKAAAPFVLLLVPIAALALALSVSGVAVAVNIEVGWGEGLALKRLPFGAPVAVTTVKRTVLSEDEKERLEEEQKKLEEALTRASDKRIKDWIGDLNQLMRDLLDGKLRPKDAYSQLAALEKAREQWNKEVGEGFEEIEKKMQRAAEKVRKSKQQDLAKVLAAMKQKDWREAAHNLDKLAQKLAQDELKRRDRSRLAKDMDKVAEALKSERQRQLEKLRRERDRLKKKEEKKKDRLSKRDRSRLKDKSRKLEQLRREQQQQSEARRQLERLQRQMSKAAQELMKRLKQQAGAEQKKMSAQEMKKAAEMMRRLAEAAKGQKQMRMGTGRMVDIKEMMRRAGQQGKDGKGKKMQRFLTKAKGQKQGGKNGEQKAGEQGLVCEDGDGQGGQSGKKSEGMLLDGSKKGGDMMLLGQGETPVPTMGESGRQGGQKEDALGDGVGDGRDGNVYGDKTDLGGKTKPDFVAGRHGPGQSQSRVIFDAATRGFSTRSYKDVHQDYAGVVEDNLERQRIPAGKRRYVRRYFDLIRPR